MTELSTPAKKPSFYYRSKYYLPKIGYIYCDSDGQILEDQTRPTDADIVDNVTNEEIMHDVRLYRNALLTASDWTQLPDVPIDDNQVMLWRTYRQQLRDYPDRIDIENWTGPDWPIPPS